MIFLGRGGGPQPLDPRKTCIDKPGFGCYLCLMTIWSCNWRGTHMVPVGRLFPIENLGTFLHATDITTYLATFAKFKNRKIIVHQSVNPT